MRHLGSSGETRGEARLVAPGRVLVNDAFARHFVDQRHALPKSGACRAEIVAGNGRANGLERVSKPRTELPVVLAVLQTLPMRLERGCVRSHVISYLPETTNLNSVWRFLSSTCADDSGRSRPSMTCRSRSAVVKSSG